MSERRTFTAVVTLALLSGFACSPANLDEWEDVSNRAEIRYTDPTIPSELSLVRTYGDHRVRIERVCSPEHCGTIGFLEYLTGEFPRTSRVSIEIRELSESVAAFVRDVVVVQSESGYSFDLIAENKYVGGPLFTLRITPISESEYSAVFTARHDDSEPEGR